MNKEKTVISVAVGVTCTSIVLGIALCTCTVVKCLSIVICNAINGTKDTVDVIFDKIYS